jgi:hypothetical protein
MARAVVQEKNDNDEIEEFDCDRHPNIHAVAAPLNPQKESPIHDHPCDGRWMQVNHLVNPWPENCDLSEELEDRRELIALLSREAF